MKISAITNTVNKVIYKELTEARRQIKDTVRSNACLRNAILDMLQIKVSLGSQTSKPWNIRQLAENVALLADESCSAANWARYAFLVRRMHGLKGLF